MLSMSYLFEVSKQADPILRKIEKIFVPICDKKVKLDKARLREYETEIASLLKQFTKLDKIKIEFKPKLFNFMVMPLYDFNSKALNKKSVFLESESDNIILEASIDKNKLNKYVKGMHIFCGIKMIRELQLTPGEIVSIILHEVGHIYYHNQLYTIILKHYLRQLGLLGLFVGLLNVITKHIEIPIFIISAIMLRTLSIFDHREEYGCDKVAAEYGYGVEMAGAMAKLAIYTGGLNKNMKRTLFGKFIDGFKTILNIGTHPMSVNRVCKVNKSMLEEYIKLYPDAKDAIESQMRELKC